MNLLFEIPDSVLIIIGIIVVLIIAIIAIIVRASSRKVKPIDEEERYDRDEFSVIEETSKNDEEEIDEEEVFERKKAKDELERVFNQMSADLEIEKQKAEIDSIDDFEREQEENAIISYQELLAHAEKLKEEVSMYEKIAEEKANMNVEEVTSKKKNRDIDERSNPKKAFKSSDIVSPIYGIQSNKNMVRQKRPRRGNLSDQERFEKEETQNLDFLNSLKEFRKNL